MNMFKKNGGFTLVELIVVIAILAILAGVAVPAYSGYIAKANDSAVLSELSAIQTAAQSACAMEGTTLKTISVSKEGEITITADDAKEQSDVEENFSDFYKASTTFKDNIKKHSEAKTKGANWYATTNTWDILKETTPPSESQG